MLNFSQRLVLVREKIEAEIDDLVALAQLPDELDFRFIITTNPDTWGHQLCDMYGKDYYCQFTFVLWQVSPFVHAYTYPISIDARYVASMPVYEATYVLKSKVADILRKRQQWFKQLVQKIKQHNLCVTHRIEDLPLAARTQISEYDPKVFDDGIFIWDPSYKMSPSMCFGHIKHFEWFGPLIKANTYLWQMSPYLQKKYSARADLKSYRVPEERFPRFLWLHLDYECDELDDVIACMIGRPVAEDQQKRVWQGAELPVV